MCVDRVVADCPGHAAEIEQQRRRSERAGDSRPSDQRAPVEVEAEEYLWPISDALHERVSADQAQNRTSEQYRRPIEAQQNRGAEPELEYQKHARAAH